MDHDRAYRLSCRVRCVSCGVCRVVSCRRAANPISAREVQVLEGLKGQLMDLPLLFLSEENLGPSASDVALKMLDSSVFT